jgi:uncharacterized membrane protein
VHEIDQITQKQKGEYRMKGHILSLVLFILGIALFLLIWLVGRNLLTGVLLGLVFVFAGLIFYRRGK